ncbi:MAG: hypothetical protein J6P21_01950 [Clostridia bacterium]|nr:hypothetical protein [Clostridia bacterium]
MSRSNKRRFAVTLLGALAFGASDASAMDSSIKKSMLAPKSNFSASKDTKLGSRNERIEKGVSVLKRGLWKKVLIGLGATVGVVGAANEAAAGITWAMGKESDSIFKGKYSFTNLIRSKRSEKDKSQNTGLKEFLKKFENAVFRGGKFKKDLVDSYNKNKSHLVSAYNKVSKSSNCDNFYFKSNMVGLQSGQEPMANAILNFIAGEKKFETNLEVSEVKYNHGFTVVVGGIDCNFVFCLGDKNEYDIKIVVGGIIILKI